jgi:hypothetical protein
MVRAVNRVQRAESTVNGGLEGEGPVTPQAVLKGQPGGAASGDEKPGKEEQPYRVGQRSELLL